MCSWWQCCQLLQHERCPTADISLFSPEHLICFTCSCVTFFKVLIRKHNLANGSLRAGMRPHLAQIKHLLIWTGLSTLRVRSQHTPSSLSSSWLCCLISSSSLLPPSILSPLCFNSFSWLCSGTELWLGFILLSGSLVSVSERIFVCWWNRPPPWAQVSLSLSLRPFEQGAQYWGSN